MGGIGREEADEALIVHWERRRRTGRRRMRKGEEEKRGTDKGL